MSNCTTYFSSGSGDLIRDQLTEVSAKGDEAYQMAVAALDQMRTEFTTSFNPSGIGSSGGESGPGGNLVAQYPVSIPDYARPTRPTVPDAVEFSAPPTPPGSVDAESLIPTQWLGTGALDEIAAQYLVLKTFYDDWLDRCSVSEQLCSVLATMLSGEIALPASVVQAMRDRARDELDRQYAQAKQEAIEDWAARGFSLPSGVLDDKIAAIQIAANDKRAGLNRDIFIEEEKFALDSQKFGVEQAVIYENNLHNQAVQLFDNARQNVMAAFGFNEATAKLRLQEWVQQVDIFKSLIESEKIRIDAALAPFDAEVRLYATDAQVESSVVDSKVKGTGLNLQRMQTHASMDEKSLELAQTKLIEASRIALSTFQSIAQVGAQLAAGWTSALHMNASLGHSTDFSGRSSCSENYNYSE